MNLKRTTRVQRLQILTGSSMDGDSDNEVNNVISTSPLLLSENYLA